MKILFYIFIFFNSTILFAQTEQRIKIISVTPSVNTGQDYSSWLNDDLNNLVPNTWTTANLSWVDVTLKLEKQSTITRLSFYDYEGEFTDKPASIYALNGTKKTFLGLFTGETYKTFVDLKLATPIVADAIIITKYNNNIPEKVQVYGQFTQTEATTTTTTEERLKLVSVTPSVNTGQDYSSWLNDDLNNLVPNTWTTANLSWVDVTLKLEKQSTITRLSFYDYEGEFTDKPASIYALNGTKKTFLGLFTGETYKTFVDLKLATPIVADAIIITKYNNNIPEKVQVYGFSNATQTVVAGKIQSVITFADLTAKTVGDAAYTLTAISNNTSTPITFTSSNTSVVTVSNASGSWKATPLSAGTAFITASQVANNNYIAAVDVAKQQVINQSVVQSATSMQGKLPLVGKYWYQLNNTGDNTTLTTGLQQLVDGNTVDPVFMGWGKLLPNYDCYYEFKNLTNVTISKIRFYDRGGNFADKPFKLYAKATVTSTPVLIGTFTGQGQNEWLDINLTTPVKAQYLIANVWSGFPIEMELYGTYQTVPNVSLYLKKEIKFTAMDGVNSFVWNFLQDWDNPNIAGKIFEPKMKLLNAFTQYRDYVDWEKIESTQGSYTFNPTQSGGWNYDLMYKRLKDDGKDVVACLKTLPAWFQQKYYPADQQDSEDVPAPYGSDLLDPNSYILQSKMAFQFAARYGSNKNISTSLQSAVVAGVIYPSAPEAGYRTRETGLGYIKYIECENERDKWWKGRKAYQTAREYAANLSAFYDGNKNTMGAGVGVKNADPDMKVVIGGTANASVDYVKGIIDWCKEFRGYKEDGSVNLCFDVINYHYYANNSNTSQDGGSTSGTAPELSESAAIAATFTDLAREYNAEVWITESGYDVNAGSPLHAPAIGNKTAEQVQADWILRTSLLYAQAGINRLFFYEAYDDNIDNSIQFSSSGLLDGKARKRKPAADYLFQTNKLIGNYTYKETIQNSPTIHRYQLQDTAVYVAYVPSAQGKTINYNLNLGSASKAKIYTLKIGMDSMDVKEVNLTNNSLNVTLSETPVFIRVLNPDLINANSSLVKSFSASSAGSSLDEIMSTKSVNSLSDSVTDINTASFASLTLYPNPAVDFVTVSFNNSIMEPVKLRIFNASNGITYKQIVTNKSDTYFTQKLDMNNLAIGTYILEIQQGGLKTSRKIIKAH